MELQVHSIYTHHKNNSVNNIKSEIRHWNRIDIALVILHEPIHPEKKNSPHFRRNFPHISITCHQSSDSTMVYIRCTTQTLQISFFKSTLIHTHTHTQTRQICKNKPYICYETIFHTLFRWILYNGNRWCATTN